MIKLNVEIADNYLTMAKGLMGRQELPQNAGMLFKFPSITEARFWGKDTYIPLDIAFIHDDKIVDIGYITPLSTRSTISRVPCTMALETNAGFFNKNRISIGHKVSINGNEIEF